MVLFFSFFFFLVFGFSFETESFPSESVDLICLLQVLCARMQLLLGLELYVLDFFFFFFFFFLLLS